MKTVHKLYYVYLYIIIEHSKLRIIQHRKNSNVVKFENVKPTKTITVKYNIFLLDKPNLLIVYTYIMHDN